MRLDRAAVVLSGLLVLAGSAPALAQPAQPQAAAKPAQPRRPQAASQPIQVYDARFENGDLRISGSVRKGGTIVVLDEDISIIADSRGHDGGRVGPVQQAQRPGHPVADPVDSETRCALDGG